MYPDESRILTYVSSLYRRFCVPIGGRNNQHYIYLLNLNKCLFACLKLTNCTHKDNGYYRGIIWELWLGDYSLREARMLVRPAP